MSRFRALQPLLTKHKLLISTTGIATLLVIGGLLVFARSNKPTAAVPKPLEVEVTQVAQTNVPIYKEWIGTTEGMVNADIKAQVTGYLLRQNYKEGSFVKKGQLLFEIDPRPFQAALARARAIVERDRAQEANARQEAGRYAELAQKEYVTAQQFEQSRTTAAAAAANLAASEADLAEARLNLQYATIRAPIAGRTGSLRVREGNLVRAADVQPLVTINQIRPILVRFAVPASHLPLIRQHRGAGVVVRAEPGAGGTASEGRLSFVDNAVDTTTGTILLKGTFPNAEGALWPGEFVNVRLQLYVDRDALTVPGRAVVSGQQGSYVFVIQPDSTAVTRPVKVERTAGEVAVVSGEVRAGDRVVTDGQLRLRQGAKVQVKAATDSAAGRTP